VARSANHTKSNTTGSNDPETYHNDGQREIDDRYRVSSLLKAKDIPHVYWLEDVLVAYGSDTQVWDLCVLVADPKYTAEVLCHAGYTLSSASAKFADDPKFCEKGLCISQRGSDSSVILYSAQDWHFQLEQDMYGLPDLNDFLDSLMDLWLNISVQDYIDRLPFGLHTASLITYCYLLEDPKYGPVNSKDYASHLKKEHRELHLEIVAADRTKNFASTPRHMYHVRRYWEIKTGEWNPPEGLTKQYKLQLSTLDEGEPETSDDVS
jgi:hypothetical protein